MKRYDAETLDSTNVDRQQTRYFIQKEGYNLASPTLALPGDICDILISDGKCRRRQHYAANTGSGFGAARWQLRRLRTSSKRNGCIISRTINASLFSVAISAFLQLAAKLQ